MRRRIFWLAVLCLLLAAALGPPYIGVPANSFAGLTIYIFLGYCAIIVVSQLFACLAGLRNVLEQWTEKRKAARRLWLR